MILVDTNILLDILEDDPVWYEWSLQQLQAQSLIHDLAVNPSSTANSPWPFIRWKNRTMPCRAWT